MLKTPAELSGTGQFIVPMFVSIIFTYKISFSPSPLRILTLAWITQV